MSGVMTPEDARPTVEQLDSMANMCRWFVDRWLDGTSESFPPHLHVQHCTPTDKQPKHLLAVLHIPFNTDVEKRGAMIQMGARLYGDQQIPMAVALMSEVWISQEVVGERRKYLLPEDDPERIEAVMYHVLAVDGGQRHAYRPFRRENDRLVPAGEWVVFGEGNMRPILLGYFFKGFFQNLSGYDAAVAAARERRPGEPKV